mmetsp:Transcript_12963/g.36512  ORF Transcript_12963/g.36512 Transcript_12963/m.36512 type:complete len:217 (-) Transcript_12963:635-1285(-)
MKKIPSFVLILSLLFSLQCKQRLLHTLQFCHDFIHHFTYCLISPNTSVSIIEKRVIIPILITFNCVVGFRNVVQTLLILEVHVLSNYSIKTSSKVVTFIQKTTQPIHHVRIFHILIVVEPTIFIVVETTIVMVVETTIVIVVETATLIVVETTTLIIVETTTLIVVETTTLIVYGMRIVQEKNIFRVGMTSSISILEPSTEYGGTSATTNARVVLH